MRHVGCRTWVSRWSLPPQLCERTIRNTYELHSGAHKCLNIITLIWSAEKSYAAPTGHLVNQAYLPTQIFFDFFYWSRFSEIVGVLNQARDWNYHTLTVWIFVNHWPRQRDENFVNASFILCPSNYGVIAGHRSIIMTVGSHIKKLLLTVSRILHNSCRLRQWPFMILQVNCGGVKWNSWLALVLLGLCRSVHRGPLAPLNPNSSVIRLMKPPHCQSRQAYLPSTLGMGWASIPVGSWWATWMGVTATLGM